MNAELSADPARAAAIDGTGSHADSEHRPLRGLGDVLIFLLAGVLVAAVGVRVVPVIDRGAPPGLTMMTVRPFIVGYRLLYLASIVEFLIWFRRAWTNAEAAGWRQRHGRAWTFWGWFMPVVNLWIPLRIMDDIWQADRPDRERGWMSQLPLLWWASWTLWSALLVLNNGTVVRLQLWFAGGPPDRAALGGGSIGPLMPDSWPSLIAFVVSGVALIAIIRTISRGPLAAPPTEAALVGH